MATKYYAVLTNVGAAKLANATALGAQVAITQMAVGDGNGVLPTPNPAQTALIHEQRRAPVNSLSIDPNNANQIIAEQVIPEDVGGWWIREIGLFDEDGDMIAVANCAETYKPQLQEGSGRVQVVRMILIVSSTEAVTLKIDPAVVLATRQYVDNQLRAHEQSRNHPNASTTEKGFVQISSSVTSDSESQAATPKAVKIAMDNASARLAKDRNLSDLPNPALARQNLGLGDSSTRNVGTTAGTVASGDDTRITGAMQKSQNGGDIPDVAKFLQNLGLGEAAKRGVGTENNQLPDMSSFAASLSGNGWQKLPSGLIIQWAQVLSNSGGFAPWTYPIAFPSACLQVYATPFVGASAQDFSLTMIGNPGKTAATTACYVSGVQSSTTGQIGVRYLAIGY
ncbi:phage tail protein [Enterobacter cloacae]|uniref:phage tail protein n=1 Tax=Enterobacter roggenkampii TaxID=1812935 RepID=UPI0010134D14|nr:phage tail protein [Enterobacter roggenkampii]QAZ64918.1 phage tail protein [Enterobacter cloacae]